MDNCDDLDKKIQELIEVRTNEVSALRKILNSLSLLNKKKEANEDKCIPAKKSK